MIHGGFHEPQPKRNAAEIQRTRRRIERYEADHKRLAGMSGPMVAALRRQLDRQLADARAYVEHLEGDSGN